MIEVRDLAKRYGSMLAVDGLSLDLRPGWGGGLASATICCQARSHERAHGGVMAASLNGFHPASGGLGPLITSGILRDRDPRRSE